MSFTGKDFRQTLGRYSTGVTVVTTLWNDQPFGMTVNSFTSVSLHPPMVLFCSNSGGQTARAIQESGFYGVSILALEQLDICKRLAGMTAVDEVDRFVGLEHCPSPGAGVPWLANSLGWLECRLEKTWEAGDHVVLLGEVIHLRQGDASEPLLFYNGGWPTIQRTDGGVG